MAEFARVESLDALKELRTFLCSLARKITVSLDEADFDIQQTLNWLKNDRYPYWKSQLAKRNEELAKAKLELNRKQYLERSPIGGHYSYIDQKRAVTRAQHRFDEAEDKLKKVRSWIPKLEKQMFECRTSLQGLSNLIQIDLPNRRTQLDQMIYSLESYMSLNIPGAAISQAAPQNDTGEDISRPVEKIEQPLTESQLLCRELKSRNPLKDLTIDIPVKQPDFPFADFKIDDKGLELIVKNSLTENLITEDDMMVFDDAVKGVDFIYLDRIIGGKDGRIKIYIGPVRQEAAANYSVCKIADFLMQYPAWRNIFLLPPDWLVMFKAGCVYSVFDADDNQIYQHQEHLA